MRSDQQKYVEQAKDIILSFKGIETFAVFLYGSRARNTNKQTSDIDIGVLGKENMPALLKLTIEEALENSDIPLKTELTDFTFVSESFRKEALKNIQIWNLPKGIKLD